PRRRRDPRVPGRATSPGGWRRTRPGREPGGRPAVGTMTTSAPAGADARALADAKGDLTIAVCLPAHDEASTIGAIVEAIRGDLVEAAPLVDAVVVLDDASTDATAAVARGAGATVVTGAAVLPEAGARRGKGEALWKSLAVVDTDLVV